MYSVPLAGRWWYAVGAPLERGVRRRALKEAPAERGLQEVPRALHVMKGRAYQPGTGRRAPVSSTTLAGAARKGLPPQLMRAVMVVCRCLRSATLEGLLLVHEHAPKLGLVDA